MIFSFKDSYEEYQKEIILESNTYLFSDEDKEVNKNYYKPFLNQKHSKRIQSF